MLRTVYFGNNAEYLGALAAVADVRAVIAQRTDNAGRTQAALARALALGIRTYRPSGPSRLEPLMRDLSPELIVVGSYDRLIPRHVFEVATTAAINIHPSLLPKYRGQHVVNWAIANGERETGVSVHHLSDTFDSGPVIAQQAVAIADTDDALTLTRKLTDIGAALLQGTVARITSSAPVGIPQTGAASYVRRRTPEDGCIDFNQPLAAIRNLVRALVRPWPGAFLDLTTTHGRRLRVTCYHCEIVESPPDLALARGEVFDIRDGIRIHHGSTGALRITDFTLGGNATGQVATARVAA
jgi:methionyl-tRNA formyltransferase